MKIECKTKFDITQTGVTGKFRPGALPFSDQAGKKIKNELDWNYSRNQQRNFETLVQLISLRTQPMEMSIPIKNNGFYQFTFIVETPDVFYDGVDDLALLRKDCDGVPMLVNLGEDFKLESTLQLNNQNANIWFTKIEE